MKRRDFVLGAAALAATSLSRTARAAAPLADRVTLLPTNDTHSRLEPFERGKLQVDLAELSLCLGNDAG